MIISPQTILTIVSILVTLGLCLLGGAFSLVCALMAYIFNTRIEELDRRGVEAQTDSRSGINNLTISMDKIRDAKESKLDSLAKDVTSIKIAVEKLRTYMGITGEVHHKPRRDARERD